MTLPPAPVPYSDSLETRQPDEEALIERIVASMGRVNRIVFDRHRHATRDAHAKSHGILKGELQVYDGLPEPLRQGVFAEPRRYPAVVRLSTAPGDLLSDRVPSPRGMAIKLLDVNGARLLGPQQPEARTQDFLLVNHPVIPFGHVQAYWEMQQIAERNVDAPQVARRTLSALARGASKVADLLGVENPTLDTLAMPNHHLLGETFYSMAALRHGDYVAKLSAAPLSVNLRALTGQPLPAEGDSALRDAVVAFFAREGAEYELRVQLCTDLQRMPIEDASVEWPESLSPWLPVAKLVLPAQDAYSPARRVCGDDQLSFNPWQGIEAHRPLGSIMRVRIKAYEASTRFRHEMNRQPRLEPASLDEIPD
ncbi:catalase family protein [Aquabacterium sp. A7-Y]|uniref:catalase family protein n=1 Tax=Aquabacterium sp. A7-Y TaxID=1349605 RepID=UPI00223E1C01|nr:catalase family protein [Aquabacterium sp. A7-Y]MCW7537075.1 catalase family protein [Aquabacterium sp. A7-Y]